MEVQLINTISVTFNISLPWFYFGFNFKCLSRNRNVSIQDTNVLIDFHDTHV